MKMELIQPFINAADAVLAQGLQSPMSIGNLSMEQEAYRRKGVAALVAITGDIEGRIVGPRRLQAGQILIEPAAELIPRQHAAHQIGYIQSR